MSTEHRAAGLRRGAKICRSMQPDKTDTEWRAAVWDALEDAAQEMEKEAAGDGSGPCLPVP